jgi:hypothetical protein
MFDHNQPQEISPQWIVDGLVHATRIKLLSLFTSCYSSRHASIIIPFSLSLPSCARALPFSSRPLTLSARRS